MLKKLSKVTRLIAKAVDGEDLTAKEAEKVFKTIFIYDKEGYHLAVLIAAMHAKGETADELLGFIRCYQKLAVKIEPQIDLNKAIDLSGTGGGEFKTINVSTLASFIVAAAGYPVAKTAYYAVTSPTGSADIFAAFGIDLAKLDKKKVKSTLEEVNLCPFIASFISPRLVNSRRIAGKILRERQLSIHSSFHLASNVYSPISLKHRIYGCYDGKYLEVLALLFAKLGFKRSLIVHGKVGIPEISNTGETLVVEQNGLKIKKYSLFPSDLGVKRATPRLIKTGGRKQNIIDFLRVLKGIDKGQKSDLVAVNAGGAFYALEAVKSLKEGTIKAKKTLHSGKGYPVLENLVKKLGFIDQLKSWELRAGLQSKG